MNHGEDGRVGPDPQRNGQEGNGGYEWGTKQDPKGQFQVSHSCWMQEWGIPLRAGTLTASY